MSIKQHGFQRSIQKGILFVKQEGIWLLLILLVYMLQAVYFAGHIEPTLDEGTYPYKGYLFLTGRYQPYEDYGPWVNKMPLSFLIAGLPQVVLGLGLRSGRVFALFLSLLMLIGLWRTARRFSGKWVALGVLAIMAINPFFIGLYSQGISQVIIACMLTWSLALVLGKDRRSWQLVAGMFLAGLMAMTRENMAPVVGLMGLYLVWDQGLRRSLPALLAGLLALVIVHAVYWPEILRNWVTWVPKSLTPFLDPWRVRLPGAANSTVQNPDFFERFYAFWHAIYLQIPLWVSVVAASVLWPFKKDSNHGTKMKPAVFLLVLFVALSVLHAIASIGGSYCIFCFENYIGFFAPAGFLLAAILFPEWWCKRSKLQAGLALLSVPLFSTGLGYASARVTAPLILNLQVPRMREMRILPGTTDLWRLLANKFGWSFNLQKYLLPALTGLALGVLILLLAVALSRLLRRYAAFSQASTLGLLILLAFSLIASPFLRLDKVTYQPPCQEEVISTYEQAGHHLAQTIPAGSLVYWVGAPIVELLYLPEVEVFPAQLNMDFSYFIGGDPDQLSRYGLWNQALADQWIKSADYVVVENSAFTGEIVEKIAAQPFTELTASPAYSSCRFGSRLRIFKRER